MPESTLQWQSFNQKKPYFIASVFSIVLGIFAVGFLFDKLAGVKEDELNQLHGKIEPAEQRSQQFDRAYKDMQKARKDLDRVAEWTSYRYYWGDVLSELRTNVLMKVEAGMRARLRTDTGIWIEQFITAVPQPDDASGMNPQIPSATPAAGSGMNAEADAAFRRRYGLSPSGAPAAAAPAETATAATPAPDGTTRPKRPRGGTNEVATITITFRAIGLNSVQPDADKETAFSVLNEMKNSPLFDAEGTSFDGDVSNEETPGTFTFKIAATLKRPLSL